MAKTTSMQLENCFHIKLSEQQYQNLERYVQLLRQWSKRVRLISKGDIDHIWERHVIDCLSFVSALPDQGKVLDFGSGAGLPGIIVAICCSDLGVDLLEPARMKSLFLRHVADELELENVNVIRMRSEDLLQMEGSQGKYDWITARAVAPLPKLFGLVKDLLSSRGTLITLKGPDAEGEFEGDIPADLLFEKEILDYPLLARSRAMVKMRHVSRET